MNSATFIYFIVRTKFRFIDCPGTSSWVGIFEPIAWYGDGLVKFITFTCTVPEVTYLSWCSNSTASLIIESERRHSTKQSVQDRWG